MQLIRITYSKQQSAKGRILDSILGTRDPLSLAINIDTSRVLALKLPKSRISEGDGVTVILSNYRKEGSQETVVFKNKVGNTLHFIHKRPNQHGGYNPYDAAKHSNSPITLVQKFFTIMSRVDEVSAHYHDGWVA